MQSGPIDWILILKTEHSHNKLKEHEHEQESSCTREQVHVVFS